MTYTTSFTHFERASNAIDEVFPAVFLRVVQSGAFHFRSHSRDDVFHFVVGKQIWNFTGRQQVIDQH